MCYVILRKLFLLGKVNSVTRIISICSFFVPVRVKENIMQNKKGDNFILFPLCSRITSLVGQPRLRNGRTRKYALSFNVIAVSVIVSRLSPVPQSRRILHITNSGKTTNVLRYIILILCFLLPLYYSCFHRISS